MALPTITHHTDPAPDMAVGIDPHFIAPAQLERLSPAQLQAIQIVVNILETSPALFIQQRTNEFYQYAAQRIGKAINLLSQELSRWA